MSRTQLRIGQITGSFGDHPGGIIDSLPVAATLGAIPELSGSLVDNLSHVASAIKRVVGGNAAASFSAIAASTLTDVGGHERITYANGAATILKADNGNTELTITDTDATFAGLVKQGTISIGSNEIDQSSGNLLLDVAGDILLDSATGVIQLDKATTTHAQIDVSTTDLVLSASTSDKDIIFMINDGGTVKQALKIDASEGGTATFADDILIKDGGTVGSATTPAAITIAGNGIVTLADDLLIKDAGTIGNASVAGVMTLADTGIVTFVDDILVKDDATIGTATTADSLLLAANGDVTLKRDATVTRNLTVTGDLTINGTTTTVDTTNLLIQDRFMMVATGSGTANRDGGFIIHSGSSGAKSDLAFGRVANDTFGVVAINSNAGAITTIATSAADLVKMRALVFEVSGSTHNLQLSGSDLAINSAGDVILDPAGNDILPGRNSASGAGLINIGSAAKPFNDVFLGDTAVVNFKNGDITLTHGANLLTLGGGDLQVAANQKIRFGGASDFISFAGDKLLIDANGVLQLGSAGVIQVTGSFEPDADGTRDLGIPSLKFNNAYVNVVSASLATMLHGGASATQTITKEGTGNLGLVNNVPAVDGVATHGLIGFRDGFLSGSSFAAAAAGSLGLASTQAEYTSFFTNFGTGTSIINAINLAKSSAGSGKFISEVTASVPNATAIQVALLDYSGVPAVDRTKLVDVFVNGQLLLTGSSGEDDYFLTTAGPDVVSFNFALETDDVVQVIVRN